MRRLAYLLSEYSDAKSQYETSKTELESMVNEAETSGRPGTPQTGPTSEKTTATEETSLVIRGQEPQETEEEKRKPVADHFRRLWRAIAKATHPDVAGDDPELLSAYKAAAESWEEGRHEELLDVAAEISLNISDPDVALVEEGEKRCEHYVKKIEEIKSTSVWQWGKAPPRAKENVLRLLVGQRALRRSQEPPEA